MPKNPYQPPNAHYVTLTGSYLHPDLTPTTPNLSHTHTPTVSTPTPLHHYPIRNQKHATPCDYQSSISTPLSTPNTHIHLHSEPSIPHSTSPLTHTHHHTTPFSLTTYSRAINSKHGSQKTSGSDSGTGLEDGTNEEEKIKELSRRRHGRRG